MQRFFVPPAWLADPDHVTLPDPLAHQLSRVLRMRTGDRIALLDNTGQAHEAELVHFEAHLVQARVLRSWQPQTESRVRLILYQSLPKGGKMDWVLQKNTELGVSVFVPLLTERAILQPADRLGSTRLERWSRIVQEAAEQSGRARLPELLPVHTLDEALASRPAQAAALLAATGAEAPALRSVLEPLLPASPSVVCLFVGPEGGFDAGEVSRARASGLQPVSLGPRILRTETAALVAFSAILYALGELEG